MKIARDTKKSLKRSYIWNNINKLLSAFCIFGYGFIFYHYLGIIGLFVLGLFIIPLLMIESHISSQIDKLMLEIKELKK